MWQLRQRKADPDPDIDCDYDPYYPASMNSSKEIRPQQQGLLRWSNAQDYYHDCSYDFLQQPPRRTFDLNSQSVKQQHRRSESGLSLSLENLELRPPSPSPICSPFDDKNYNKTTSASACASFSFFTPRNSFGQSDLHISQQHCNHGEEDAGSVRSTTMERSSPAGGFCRREKDGMRSTFYDGRKSTSLLSINPRKTPARFSFKDEFRPKLCRQQGFSVRRANLPRGTCRSDPQIILLEEIHDPALELSDINVVQPNPAKNGDSNANNASNRTAKDPKTSSQRFEPLINGMYGVQVCDENVEKRSRSSYMDRRDEIEAETIALQGATSTSYLNWWKREEEHIIAWERKQKAKADKHMKNFERKLDKKRAKEIWKTQKKIARAHKKAEKKVENIKAAERAKIEDKNARAACLGNGISSVGMLPWKCLFS